MIFDTAHPIGDKYIQYPYEPDPNTLYNKNGVVSEWQDISNHFAGLFMRFAGGEAETFEKTLNARVSGTTLTFETTSHGVTTSSLIINPDTWERHGVAAVNGASITLDHIFNNEQNITKVLIVQADAMQGHIHGLPLPVVAHSYNASCDGGYGSTYSPDVRSTTTPISDGKNGTPRIHNETRSKNITVRLWKRIN